MRKIISLFQRNYDGDHLVRNELVSGAEWVPHGEGIATRKWDGTCCMIANGHLFKRFELKKSRTAPPLFVAAQEPDPVTGDTPGWIPVSKNEPEDRWHREAHRNSGFDLPDGTYELIGPRINKNPDGAIVHSLIRHGEAKFENEPPRDFLGLRDWFEGKSIEGIVWHHSDGRMVKIKAKDFGFRRGLNGN